MKKFLLGAVFAVAAATSAQAATLIVDLDDIASIGEYGDSGNVVLSFYIGANAHVTAVNYDVTLTAFSPSWLSEMAVDFTDSDFLAGVALTPGFADTGPGTASYADGANLVDLGLDFFVGADGYLVLTFYETFDDSSVTPDGLWNGTLTFTHDGDGPVTPTVPEPATWGMMIAGFGLVGTAMRRRRETRVTA